MTTMTVAQARAAGLLDAPKGKRRPRNEVLPERGMELRCHTCGVVVVGPTALARHDPDHHRFEVVR